MKELTTEINQLKTPICVAFGFFDSVHFAHRKIIKNAIIAAKRLNVKSAVMTFTLPPLGKERDALYLYKERKAILKGLGADYIIPFDFNKIKTMCGAEFIDFFCSSFNVVYASCGYDFRFGNDNLDADALKTFLDKKNIVLETSKKICLNGKRVSTTFIAKLIKEGNVKCAAKYLDAPFFLSGKVIHGNGLGNSLLGFPTANLLPKDGKLLPKSGVYISKTTIGSNQYLSLTNIGQKPTFNGKSCGIETYIKGYNGNIYGKNIKIHLLDYLREIKKFLSANELSKQIANDLDRLNDFKL